jgi:hypothetical protein
MCVFGVTRIQPELVQLLQVEKPILLLALGFWSLLSLADSRTQGHALLSSRLLLALPLAAIALLDSAAEATYLLREKPAQAVTCCTQFVDTDAARLANRVSLPPFAGLGAPGLTVVLYYLLSAAVIGGAAYLYWKLPGKNRLEAVVLPACLVALGALNLIVTRQAWLETVAPRVLELPYHHCVYEVLTEAPALALAALMTLAGNGCLLWPPALEVWKGRAPQAIFNLQRSIYGLCAIALSSAAVIVTVHIL